GGPQGQRLEHVTPTAHPAVEQHGNPAGDPIDELCQGIRGADRAVDLASAVVRDDDAVDTSVDRALRVIRVLNALEHDRQARVLSHEIDVLPLEARAREHVEELLHGGAGFTATKVGAEATRVASGHGDKSADGSGRD